MSTQISAVLPNNTVLEGATTQAEIATISESATNALLDNISNTDSDEGRKKVSELTKLIDMTDSNSILTFGADAQKGLTDHSNSIIGSVRNKDAGAVGSIMNDLVTDMRGLNFEEAKDMSEPGFFKKMLGGVAGFTKFVQKYESIESQIKATIGHLQKNSDILKNDIKQLDIMRIEAIEYYGELGFIIEAAKAKHEEVLTTDIPSLKTQAENSGDPLDATKVQNLIAAADELGRRIHDLELTKTVTLSLIPKIGIIQDSDKALVAKIQSQILNGVPMWTTNIAMMIQMKHTEDATNAVTSVDSHMDEMMRQSGSMLKSGAIAAAEASNRGVVSVEAVEQQAKDIIETLRVTQQINEDGRKFREEATTRLQVVESDLAGAMREATDTKMYAA